MREFLEDLSSTQPIDPTESARRALKPNLRKRFYAMATVGEGEGGFSVLLDGRTVRTPARRVLAAPAAPIAQALAEEWQAQHDAIDPARMPLTRLANSIIDGVADASQAVADEIASYLRSDLLFYRADGPLGLVSLQSRHWDPVLGWAADALRARFLLAEGVVHVAQPEAAIEAVRRVLPDEPWLLGALHSVTTLTGSALLALALLRGRLSVQDAWTAAHVDEDWNMQQWGRDDLVIARREHRFGEMQAADTILRALA